MDTAFFPLPAERPYRIIVQNNPVNWIDPFGLIVLPPNPLGLPCCWQYDPSHQYEYGMQFRHPSGDILEFHIGIEGRGGKKERDHWHFNRGKKHLYPGDEIPGGECPELEDKRSLVQKISDAWENLKDFIRENAPKKPRVPIPVPFPAPVPIPVP